MPFLIGGLLAALLISVVSQVIPAEQPEGDPCFSGIYMYHSTDEEVAKVVDEFVVRLLGPDGVVRERRLLNLLRNL